ncbi:hypothetical protein BHM03_00060611, partial [Ensete ventricosum]
VFVSVSSPAHFFYFTRGDVNLPANQTHQTLLTTPSLTAGKHCDPRDHSPPRVRRSNLSSRTARSGWPVVRRARASRRSRDVSGCLRATFHFLIAFRLVPLRQRHEISCSDEGGGHTPACMVPMFAGFVFRRRVCVAYEQQPLGVVRSGASGIFSE